MITPVHVFLILYQSSYRTTSVQSRFQNCVTVLFPYVCVCDGHYTLIKQHTNPPMIRCCMCCHSNLLQSTGCMHDVATVMMADEERWVSTSHRPLDFWTLLNSSPEPPPLLNTTAHRHYNKKSVFSIVFFILCSMCLFCVFFVYVVYTTLLCFGSWFFFTFI